MRNIVGSMLRQTGITMIQTASSGAEALYLMKRAEQPFDLVLADQHMDLVGGMPLLKLMRAEGIKSLFVLMTAEPSEQMVVEARKRGAFAILAKPFSTATLINVLSRVGAGPRHREDLSRPAAR
jgi:DNA-binding NtrC family response regulator